MTKAGAMTSRIVTDMAGWEALRPWWDSLLEASTDSTPWQTWDYLANWWRNLAEDRKLRIVVVESAGTPVMIFPMQITKEWMIGVPTRLLEPISMMWDVNRPRVALGAHDQRAFQVGLETLWGIRSEWDSIRIEELPLEDPQARELRAFAERRELWFRDVLSSVCPTLRVDQRWDDFMKTRGNRLRKNLRASMRKLEGEGAVELQTCSTAEEVEQGFEVMLQLHQRSWKKKKHVGLSLSPQFREFFRGFLTAMAARGRACVLVLRCGDRPVAATVAFLHLDTYFSTEIVHDAAFAKCSPGTLLESMEIERLMTAGGFRHYDFLGRFLSNKQRWTDDARVTSRIYLFRPNASNYLLDLHYFRAKPVVKRIWRSVFGLSRATAQALRFVKPTEPA
jgi:CelD/BcsL family acetyltransferase involved in cellulose biosynthesis